MCVRVPIAIHSPTGTGPVDTIFMGGMFIGGAVGSAGASLAWEAEGWGTVCAFGIALVAIALGLHVCGRVAAKRARQTVGPASPVSK